jgi:ribonuclease-3
MATRLQRHDREPVEERIGHSFRDPGLLAAALTHASALPPGAVRASEQLEFLGDAVLGLIVAELLLRAFPDLDEGKLSKRRALLVCKRTLAMKARALGLGEALRLGRGEERSGGREKESILAATYEALIGAVFRDAGFARTRALVRRHFRSDIEIGAALAEHDPKTALQERTQAELRALPEYVVIAERGPAHARRFDVEVRVDGRALARGEGPSKREAEQQAADRALKPDGTKATAARRPAPRGSTGG